jgi:hypothetical protein
MIALTIRTRNAQTHRSQTVKCGTGRLIVTAPHSHTVHMKFGKPCNALLRRARHHRLKASLKAVFSTHQAPLRRAVTLAGT